MLIILIQGSFKNFLFLINNNNFKLILPLKNFTSKFYYENLYIIYKSAACFKNCLNL